MGRIVNVGSIRYKKWHLIAGAAFVTLFSLAIGIVFNLGPTDDAYITYRHAENFARGHGLVFNPGEPVEGTSNFLFALLVGILSVLKIPPVFGSSLINHLSLFAIAYLLLKNLSQRLASVGRSGFFAYLSLTFLVLSPSLVFFVWVGLETPFYTALLFASCLKVLEGAQKNIADSLGADSSPEGERKELWKDNWLPPRQAWRPLVLSGVFLGLAAATRMEAAIAGPAFAVLLVRELGIKRSIGALALIGISCLMVFLPFFAYRWSFYGFPFPNTYYAKVDGGTLGLLLRGVIYVALFVNMYAVYILVMFVVVLRAVLAGRDRSRATFIVVLFSLQIIYVVYVGGDFFPYMRFVVPVFPVVALGFGDILAFGVRGAPARPGPSRSFSFRAAQVALVLLIIGFHGMHALLQPAHIILAASQQHSVKKRSAVGKMLLRNVPDDMSLLVGAAGAIPYYSKLTSYDAFGLTDPFLAHKQVYLGPGRPGHEKFDILGQMRRYRPDLILFYSLKAEYAARARPGEVEANFYYQVEQYKKDYQEFGEYVPLRLEGPHAIAMVTAKESILHRLGPNFEAIAPPEEPEELPVVEESEGDWPIIKEPEEDMSSVHDQESESSN